MMTYYVTVIIIARVYSRMRNHIIHKYIYIYTHIIIILCIIISKTVLYPTIMVFAIERIGAYYFFKNKILKTICHL